MESGIDMPLVLDVVVVVLLVATIGYAVVLNRRIGEMRKWKAEFDRLITTFNQATERAEAGIQSLKSVAIQRGPDLQRSLDKACSLRDDLAYLVERGDTLADRLTEAVRSAIPTPRVAAAPTATSTPAAAESPAADSKTASPPGSKFGLGAKSGGRRNKTARALLKALEGMR